MPYPDVDPRPNFPDLEQDVLARWAKDDTFQASIDQRPAGEFGANEFVFYDGPPFANGLPHYGHLLTGYVKDAIPRYQTMRGHRVERRFGWDCHGLPIELQVEKKIGKPGHKVTAAQFRKACREYAAKQVDGQRADFQRLGVLGDWGNPYLTMDFRFEADIVRALGRIIANGHVQQGSKPVHWCIDCGSALAEADGTTVIYVWDVFDMGGTRLHRIQGQERQPGTSNPSAPWSQITLMRTSSPSATRLTSTAEACAWRTTFASASRNEGTI